MCGVPPFSDGPGARPEKMKRLVRGGGSGAALNADTWIGVVRPSEWGHPPWQVLSACETALLRGPSSGGGRPHWSAVISMWNAPAAPWCWRETLALRCATAARSREPKLSDVKKEKETCTHVHADTPAHKHLPGEPLSAGVLFPVFILGLLTRRAVSAILSGPADLSLVVQPSSPPGNHRKRAQLLLSYHWNACSPLVHWIVLIWLLFQAAMVLGYLTHLVPNGATGDGC